MTLHSIIAVVTEPTHLSLAGEAAIAGYLVFIHKDLIAVKRYISGCPACAKRSKTHLIPPLILLGMLLATLLLCSGCVAYRHTSPAGDKTRFNACLMWGNASAIKSQTADTNGYVRAVSLGKLAAGTETEKLAPLVDAAVRAGVGAAAQSMAPGIPRAP